MQNLYKMESKEKIKHLYWRAGFGLSPEEWKNNKDLSINQAVAQLFNKAKKVKKETTDSKLSEIEKNGKIATLEMQIEALEEIISIKNERLSMVSEDESLSELVDKKKMKEMQKEIKRLKKSRKFQSNEDDTLDLNEKREDLRELREDRIDWDERDMV